ncbi:hypothetical protein CR513_33332, partial [Mucuna pruriens]
MAMGEQFDEISFHYVPRDKNQMADALSILSSMLQVKQGREMTIHTKMEHYQQLEEAKVDGKPWYYDIREYLREGVYRPQQLRMIRGR